MLLGFQDFEIMRCAISNFYKHGTLDRITVFVEVNVPSYASIGAGIRDGISNLFPIGGV